jgi:hypothetical protein
MQSAQDNASPSANYLSQFYLDLENLTTQVSNYNNLMAYLNEKYNNLEEKEMKKEDYVALDQFSQQCRFWANRLYIKFRALSEKFEEFKAQSENIEKIYKQVATKRIVSFDDIHELVIAFNTLFVGSVCEKFFVDTQKAFSQISGAKNE